MFPFYKITLLCLISLNLIFPFVHSTRIPLRSHNEGVDGALSKYLGEFGSMSNGGSDPDLLWKTIVPIYMQEFFALYRKDSDTFLRQLGEGVVNEGCIKNIEDMILHLSKPLSDNPWALQMVDAWGKIPDGILSGHLNSMGDFDECLNIKVTEQNDLPISSKFIGNYCPTMLLPYFSANSPARNLTDYVQRRAEVERILNEGLEISPRKSASVPELLALMMDFYGALMVPSIGTCFPSSCSVQDVDAIINNALSMPISPNQNLNLAAFVTTCYTNEKPDFDAGDITMIVVLSVIGILCVIGTIIDFIYRKKEAEFSSLGKGVQSILAFSVYTNTKKWLSTKTGSDNFGCIHGIRFLSMSWVILSHTWVMLLMTPMWNMVDVKSMYKDHWTVFVIINGFVSVDAFFLMSGFLVTYGLLKTLDKSRGQFNIFLFYLHRYLRLTPTYVLLIGIMATVFPYFGNGPNWQVIDVLGTFCEKNWWHNILYINNLVDYTSTTSANGMCQGESWYLANDMQFFILSPFIVYPLWKWQKLGMGILSVLSFGSILTPFLITYLHEFVPTPIFFRNVGNFMDEVYVRPWTRIGPYLVGIWLGLLIYKTRNMKIKLTYPQLVIGWIVSTVFAAAIIFGIIPFYDPSYDIPRLSSAFYGGFHHFVWGIVLSWIIFVCVKGYGGVVNSFLSWKVFIPLGRLTFCTYLISTYIQMLYHNMARQPTTYHKYAMTNLFLSHLVMSLFAGFICTITMESPFIQLQKFIFPSNKPAERSADPIPVSPTIVIK